MKIEIKIADADEINILANLLEKYEYEFSQYDRRPFNNQGLYDYKYLKNYWLEDSRFPYLIYADDSLAGFALINKIAECNKKCDWSVAEFFVGYLYRRRGVATQAMNQIFSKHKGYWHIKYHNKNLASVEFWNKLAKSVACDKLEILDSDEFYDKSKGKVLIFKI